MLLCSCLPLLPVFACSIQATWIPSFNLSLYIVISLKNFLPAQDGDDGDVGDKTGNADDELQDDLQPEVDHGVRLHVLKRVDESAVGWLVAFIFPLVTEPRKVLVRGLVKFASAFAYHFCLNLPAIFSQPRAKTFSQLCNKFSASCLESIT